MKASQHDIERMEQELVHGRQESENDDTTLVRAGFIGELTMSHPPTSLQWRQLQASAVVQHTTTAPLWVAVAPPPIPTRDSSTTVTAAMTAVDAVLDQIVKCGGDLTKVVMTQMDLYLPLDHHDRKWSILRHALDRGVCLCFDRWTLSSSIWDLDQVYPTIPQVVQAMGDLVTQNPQYLHQLVLSNGIHMKLQYTKYGGMGYGALSQHLLPRLQRVLTASQMQVVLCETPQRLLSWWTPPPPPPAPKEYLACSVCHNLFEPILGQYYQKFTYTYCGKECLKTHRLGGYKPLD